MNSRPCSLDLYGKIGIVTGAARGIGKATAEMLCRKGARVLLQDIDSPALQETCDEMIRQGYEVAMSIGDVSDRFDVQKMVDKTVGKWGRIDILVNNAGIGGDGKNILDLEPEEWHRMIEVDLSGVYLCCRATVPHMIEQKRGSIINISSITGQMGVPGSTHYAAAKAGVIGFSKSLASEIAEYFINVNVVSPGLIDTSMSRNRGIDHQRHLVLWPHIGEVNDIAWAVGFLASEHAKFITGAVINVNGGAYM